MPQDVLFVIAPLPASKSALHSNRRSRRPPTLRAAGDWPDIGFGTIAWGDSKRGFGTGFTEKDLRAAYDYAVQDAEARGSAAFFDTAEVYGYQGHKAGESAECLLGSFETARGGVSPHVATKYFPVLWTNALVGGGLRIGRKAVVEALRASLTRLGRGYVDLYQIHFNFPYLGGFEALADGLAECMDAGLVRGIGVSNYGVQDIATMSALLDKRGYALESNQIAFNLLNREAETNGVIETCKERGIQLIAHSPFQGGILTTSALESGSVDSKYRPLLNLMKLTGAFAGGKTVSQVALAYIAKKGLMPIPGVKSEGHVREALGALDFDLDQTSIDVLEEKSDFILRQTSSG